MVVYASRRTPHLMGDIETFASVLNSFIHLQVTILVQPPIFSTPIWLPNWKSRCKFDISDKLSDNTSHLQYNCSGPSSVLLRPAIIRHESIKTNRSVFSHRTLFDSISPGSWSSLALLWVALQEIGDQKGAPVKRIEERWSIQVKVNSQNVISNPFQKCVNMHTDFTSCMHEHFRVEFHTYIESSKIGGYRMQANITVQTWYLMKIYYIYIDNV